MNFFFVNVAYAGVDEFVRNANDLILNPLINLLFALAFVVFLYGVVQFLANPESEEKRSQGKMHMLWGIIGLTIMFSVWGILNIVLDTFQIEGINPKAGTVKLNDYNPQFPKLGN